MEPFFHNSEEYDWIFIEKVPTDAEGASSIYLFLPLGGLGQVLGMGERKKLLKSCLKGPCYVYTIKGNCLRFQPSSVNRRALVAATENKAT